MSEDGRRFYSVDDLIDFLKKEGSQSTELAPGFTVSDLIASLDWIEEARFMDERDFMDRQ